MTGDKAFPSGRAKLALTFYNPFQQIQNTSLTPVACHNRAKPD